MADYRNSGILNTDGSGTVNIGLANNNPGDLKCCDGNNWVGLVGNDGTFDTFSDTTYGIRAMAIDLTTKIQRDGLNTITSIISDYAPPSENNTAAYIASVVNDTGYTATQVLTADSVTLANLIRAIINHEIGDQLSNQYVSDSDVQAGLSMMAASAPGSATQIISAAAEDDPLITAIILGGVMFMLAKIFS
jgi:hypothetical protein